MKHTRLRASLILTSVIALALAGCATPTTGAGAAPLAPTPSAAFTPVPSESASTLVGSGSADAQAQAQAQARAWLAEATLPAGAVRATADVTSFDSYTSWPCGPLAELKAYWKIPGTTVSEAANWILEHPTGNLIPTRHSPVPDDPRNTSAMVGYIPAQGAQQGIVYTVEKMPDGVAVRAEIAAQTSTASCPPLPAGDQYGAPGLG